VWVQRMVAFVGGDKSRCVNSLVNEDDDLLPAMQSKTRLCATPVG